MYSQGSSSNGPSLYFANFYSSNPNVTITENSDMNINVASASTSDTQTFNSVLLEVEYVNKGTAQKTLTVVFYLDQVPNIAFIGLTLILSF